MSLRDQIVQAAGGCGEHIHARPQLFHLGRLPHTAENDGVPHRQPRAVGSKTFVDLQRQLPGGRQHQRAHRAGAFAEILTERVRIIRVPGEAVLRGAKGDTVSFLPLGDARGVTLTGFFYPLSGHDLHSDYPLGVSNVVTQDEARVSVKSGDLLMFHNLP